MKRLIAFVKTLTFPQVMIALAVVAALGLILSFGVDAMRTRNAEERANKLETEKRQILKERDEARARDLILQGEIKAKDQVIESLTSQIAESNQRVTVAHRETQSARVNYEKVRSDPPKFNASDDAGRVLELRTGLHELYPDPPR